MAGAAAAHAASGDDGFSRRAKGGGSRRTARDADKARRRHWPLLEPRRLEACWVGKMLNLPTAAERGGGARRPERSGEHSRRRGLHLNISIPEPSHAEAATPVGTRRAVWLGTWRAAGSGPGFPVTVFHRPPPVLPSGAVRRTPGFSNVPNGERTQGVGGLPEVGKASPSQSSSHPEQATKRRRCSSPPPPTDASDLIFVTSNNRERSSPSNSSQDPTPSTAASLLQLPRKGRRRRGRSNSTTSAHKRGGARRPAPTVPPPLSRPGKRARPPAK